MKKPAAQQDAEPTRLESIGFPLRSAVSDLQRLFKQCADVAAEEHAPDVAGKLLVFERDFARRFAALNPFVPGHGGGDWTGPGYAPLEPAVMSSDQSSSVSGRPAPARARATGDHRHKFDAAGRCTVPDCAHVRGAGGRPRKAAPAQVERPSAEARTVNMPIVDVPSRPDLAAAADRFAGGGMGSSGTGDRR